MVPEGMATRAKRKPLQSTVSDDSMAGVEEEIEGIAELVHEKMPKAEQLQKQRKKEIQRLLSIHGG